MTKKKPLPYKMYPEDWIDNVDNLSWSVRGILAQVLNLIWRDYRPTCSVPQDEAEMIEKIGCTEEEWSQFRSEIISNRCQLLIESPIGLFCKSLWDQQETHRRRAERLQQQGRLGGRPPKKSSEGNPQGLPEEDEVLRSNTESKNILSNIHTPRARERSWLAEYNDIWKSHYGGNIPYAKWAKTFKQLEEEHGAELIHKAWNNYCKTIEARYNPDAYKFAKTIGAWAVKAQQGHELVTLNEGRKW